MSTTTDSRSSSSATPDINSELDKSGDRNATVKRKSKASKRWNTTMKLVRRIHLYSGLFMFPWVLLYGITGMFFNHPRWFTGDETQTFVAAEVNESSLAQLPSPESLAQNVVAALNQQLEETSGSPVVLTDLRPPEYSGDLTYNVNTDEVSHTVTINPVTGDGEIRTTQTVAKTETATAPSPLAGLRRVDIDENPLLLAQDAVPDVLDQLGLPSGTATSGRRAATLTFSAEVEGEPVAIVYNLGNGFVATTSENAELPMNSKSFLQRLHLSRGFSPHWNLKTLWGLMVDLMFLSMVFWGLSGLFMWWQIKRTRLLGGGFIIASLAITAFFIVGMHDSFTVAGSRRGGGNRGQGGGAAAVGRNGQAAASQNPGRGGNRGPGGRGNRGGNRGNAPVDSNQKADADAALFEELEQMLLEQEQSERKEKSAKPQED